MKFLTIRHELYGKSVLMIMDLYAKKGGRNSGLLEMEGTSTLAFLMDNSMLLALFALVRGLNSSSELDSIRNQMSDYAQVMAKFKELVDEKKSGKAVESWLNMMWDRQVKRGVVQ